MRDGRALVGVGYFVAGVDATGIAFFDGASQAPLRLLIHHRKKYREGAPLTPQEWYPPSASNVYTFPVSTPTGGPQGPHLLARIRTLIGGGLPEIWGQLRKLGRRPRQGVSGAKPFEENKSAGFEMLAEI